ncbi:hypothetical protein SNEBB_001812 [Seison nebaliae]|nr:hypothetical protein SNEBB_001812 [Seison nebaliae]
MTEEEKERISTDHEKIENGDISKPQEEKATEKVDETKPKENKEIEKKDGKVDEPNPDDAFRDPNPGPDRLLWDIAHDLINLRKEKQKNIDELSNEYTTLVLGSQRALKTTIIYEFLGKALDKRTSTTGLDYNFGRKFIDKTMKRIVGHVWELGDGTDLLSLVKVVLNERTAVHSSVILVIDLGVPEEIWHTATECIAAVKPTVNTIIGKILKKKTPEALEIIANVKHRNAKNKDMKNSLYVPFAIIATNYSKFQGLDPENQKVICQALRYLTFANGGYLITYDDKTKSNINMMLNSFVFKEQHHKIKHPNRTYTSPLSIGPGSDDLSDIKDTSLIENKNNEWNGKMKELYPKRKARRKLNQRTKEEKEEIAKNFHEPDIDAAKDKNEFILKHYRKNYLEKQKS